MCQHMIHAFACGCAYLSPCSSCPKPVAIRSQTAGRTNFDSECSRCQTLGLDLELEFAKQHYEDIMELWGESDEDTDQLLRDYNQRARSHERQTKAVMRDWPSIDEWEVIQA